MSHEDREHDRHERRELEVLEYIWEGIRLETHLLRQIISLLQPPILSSIKVILSGGITMPVGPLTISVGQKYVASVVGFDQNGAPFTGPIPTPTFADDNAAVATTDPTAGTGSGLSAGIDNITASLTSAEGVALTDTETLTVPAIVPVLSSIKVSLDPA